MKQFFLFGWYEYPSGESSSSGGAGDLMRDSKGVPLSFDTADAAKAAIDQMVTALNVIQVFDASTGKFVEFERQKWVERAPKPPKRQPPGGAGGGGGAGGNKP